MQAEAYKIQSGDLETFWCFALNGDERIGAVKGLFEALEKAG